MTSAYDKIKSTIDKHCTDAVTAAGVALQAAGFIAAPFAMVDVDDVVNADEKMKSQSPLIGWRVESVFGAPRAPLFAVTFCLVFRLPNDASNAAQAKAIAALEDSFRAGDAIDIEDFIDPLAAGQKFGRLYMSSTTVMPAAYDANASVREVRVEGRASCR